MTSTARQAEFESIQRAVTAWAEREEPIVAVLLVGSWARRSARADSDIDVVVLGDTERFTTEQSWIGEVVGPDATLLRTADWGALIERRVQLATGCEIELGFAAPSWADLDPIDPGTRRVVSNGCRIWYDPTGLLSRLLAAAGVSE